MGSNRTLVMAYADPPYIGQSKKHYEDHADYAGEVDHEDLVARLVTDYPDGWALSLSAPTTHLLLDICRANGLRLEDGDIRLCSWVKPFAAFKRNVRVAYAWEPVIVKPAERLDGAIPTRDFVAESITMRRGLSGAKPERFCHWLFAVMGLRRTDELHDLFHGSGAVARAWESWTMQMEVAA
jgi:hypothetical protein